MIREQSVYTYEAGRSAIRSLMSRKDPPDAVFCAADIIALGVMDEARYQLNLRVPQDLAVAGFDDITAAGWPTYNLTTIRQPADEMVAAAVQMIDSSAEITKNPEVQLFPVELLIRGSA